MPPLELALGLLEAHACVASGFLAALPVSAWGHGPGTKHLATPLHLSILSIPGPAGLLAAAVQYSLGPFGMSSAFLCSEVLGLV